MQTHNPTTIWPVPDVFQRIYSHAVEITGPVKFLFVSGQIGIDPDGVLPNRFAEQCNQAMANVEGALSSAGLSTSDLLRVTYYLTNTNHLAELTNIRDKRWGSSEPPAVTTLVVVALAKAELLVEIEVIAGKELDE